ncbi:MAG: ABC transporter permease [Anaerolineaceae bacterium]|nr:ABC transporter permease [Anaerolineaceae bacterium]
MSEKVFNYSTTILAYLVLFFLLLPIAMIIVGAVNPAPIFSFPPKGVSLVWFNTFLQSKEYQSAIRVSTVVASYAVVIGLFAGIPAAFALDRYQFAAKNIVHSLFLSSMMLPRVIWAIGLLQFYSNLKMLGSLIGLILAHVMMVMPYVIRMVLASLSFVNRDLETAAQSLGATPRRSFLEITLPLVLPGIIVGAVLGFVVSFTDTVIAVFISGVRNITFPVRIYVQQRGQGLDPVAIAGSVIVILVIFMIEIIGEKLFKWSRFM